LGLVSGGLRKQAAIFLPPYWCLEIMRQNLLDSAAEFLAVLRPDALSPITVTTGL